MSKRTEPVTYDILGVNVHRIDMDTAARVIIAAADSHRPHYITKPYVEFFTSGRGTPATDTILNRGLLCLPDGVSLQWATAYLYGGQRTWWRALGLAAAIIVQPSRINRQLPVKFSGATFTWVLLEQAAAAGKSVYLVGSPQDGSIKQTATAIKKRLPNLVIAGTWPGKLDGMSGTVLQHALPDHPVEAELVHDLKSAKPDIILVGMGFPIQELLIAKLTRQIGHGVFIGEGGTFDYDSFGGNRSRAPQLVRRIGLEWFWRLVLEPSRWKRQLAIPRFMWAVYRQGRRTKPPES